MIGTIDLLNAMLQIGFYFDHASWFTHVCTMRSNLMTTNIVVSEHWNKLFMFMTIVTKLFPFS